MQIDTQTPRDCLRLAREGWLARWKRKANCVPVTESALPPKKTVSAIHHQKAI